MKYIQYLKTFVAPLLAVAALVCFCASLSYGSGRAGGKTMGSLWREYERYESLGLPARAEKVLREIVDKAAAQKSYTDFTRAGIALSRTVCSYDWKASRKLRNELQEKAVELGNPVVTFRLAMSDVIDLCVDPQWIESEVFARKDVLRAEYHPQLYSMAGENPVLQDFLIAAVRNDYEFLLWSLYGEGRGWSWHCRLDEECLSKVLGELKSEVGESYPAGAWLEYQEIVREDDCGDTLAGFASKWRGKAVAVYAQGRILEGKFSRMCEDLSSGAEVLRKAERLRKVDGLKKEDGLRKPSSEDFISFRSECEAFEKRRKAFRGAEFDVAESCRAVEEIIDRMDSRSLSVSASEGKVRIVAQNVGKAVVTLSAGETPIHTETVANPVKSYFVPDTLCFTLPEIPDGVYSLDCRSTDGKVSDRASYVKHTISTALRRIAGAENPVDSSAGNSFRMGAYVADYLSGKPLDKADVEISFKGQTVLNVKDFPLGEGFVDLSSVAEAMPDSLKDGRVLIRFSGTGENGLRRESELMELWDIWPRSGERSAEEGSEGHIEALVLTDRGAYNPGETVHFKSVLYRVLPEGRMSALSCGESVEAVLLGPKNSEIGRISLVSNDFGSVFGAFEIKADAQGGIYRVNILKSGKVVSSRSLRVDEFVLPSWTLEFDKDTTAYFDGDEVSVGGWLKSYSGHSLSGASVRYKVSRRGETVDSGEVRVKDGGRFDFGFKTLDTGEEVRSVYAVEVIVSDLTGETLQWRRTVTVNPFVSLSLTLENEAEGTFRIDSWDDSRTDSDGGSRGRTGWGISGEGMPQGDSAVFRLSAFSSGGFCPVNVVRYELLRGREVLLSGDVSLNETASGNFELDLSGMPSGMYRVVCTASYTRSDGMQKSVETHYDIFRAPSGDDAQDFGKGWFYKKESRGISALAGCSDGEEWIVAELYDGECHLLDSRNIHLSGVRAGQGSVERISFDYRDEYPEKVLLSLLCFRDAGVRSCTIEFERPLPERSRMELSFERFRDRTLPGTRCSVSLLGEASAEFAATVFDVSTEVFGKNLWSGVGAKEPPFERVWCRTFSGRASSVGPVFRKLSSSSGAAGPVLMNSKAADRIVVEESAFADDLEAEAGEQNDAGSLGDIRLRENFRKTLAFRPALLPDASGKVSFEFEASDALGTYAVSVFSHDRNMRNAVIRREFLVTCPVKVSVVPPSFLYEGDLCRLRVAVANSGAEPVAGILSVSVFGGDDHRNLPPVLVRSVPLEVPADGQSSSVFEIAVPSFAVKSGTLGVKAVFSGRAPEVEPVSGASSGGVSGVCSSGKASGNPSVEVSDGIFLSIPVLAANQTLTEAHSALLLPGADRDSLKNVLWSSFTGTSPDGAEYSEKTLSSLLLRDIEQSALPSSKDLVSLLSAYYSRAVLSYIRSGRNSADEAPSPSQTVEGSDEDILLNDNLLKDIFACRNADGGFAWFKGFPSSPILTALALERFAALRDLCTVRPDDLEISVRYLDNVVASGKPLPQWQGGITMERYLYVRSMYGYVLPEGVTDDLKKSILRILLPGKASSGRHSGTILENALHTSTLVRLSAPDCAELLSAWGIRSKRKFFREASLRIASLADHSVSRPDGAVYFPNAVMPWRGLLESEAYAHTLLCNLFSSFLEAFSQTLDSSEVARYERIADGLRLWMMLQKESQKWSGDPACKDALLAILGGSDRVLSAKLAVVTKRYVKPLEDIREAGNGMKVQREFYRQSLLGKTSGTSSESGASPVPESSLASGTVGRDSTGWVLLNEGDTLAVGEKVLSVIRLWSGENRSFVMLDAPHHAFLRPVEQLSGISGGRFPGPFLPSSDIQSAGTPLSYREVKRDRTQWYMEVCPEEWSTFCEEYFVVCGGEFTSPVISVESLYTPHYRANSNFSEKMFAY